MTKVEKYVILIIAIGLTSFLCPKLAMSRTGMPKRISYSRPKVAFLYGVDMKICKVDGCDNKFHAHGYCSKHNTRVQKYGSPYIVKAPRIYTECTINGCSGKHEAKGLCKKHYYIKNRVKQSENNKKNRLKNKDGIAERKRLYHIKNREKINAYSREHYIKNKEKVATYQRQYKKENYEDHKKRKREYMKKRCASDPIFKLNKNMSRRMLESFICKNGRNWKKLVGYSIKDLKHNLEIQFDNNMSWDNYGSYWHVDHIIPLSYFKNCSEKDILEKAWTLSNLQPLKAIENIKKSNKLNYKTKEV